MDSLRLIAAHGISPLAPCSQCQATGCQWDRIADLPFCPDCEEALALGEAGALVIRTQRIGCAICDRPGTVPFLTFPLRSPSILEMQLCADHFRALLARRLGPQAFQMLQRRLQNLGLTADQIFLLHEVFYDAFGRALQPVDGMD
jgi:hypothetical protein